MTSAKEARQKVEEYLRELSASKPFELVVMDSLTRSEEFGWVFFYNTKEFLETGDMNAAVGGNAPLIVERGSGNIHVTGTAHPVEHYLEIFRSKYAASTLRSG